MKSATFLSATFLLVMLGLAASPAANAATATRSVQAGSTLVDPSASATVTITLNSLGNENAAGFTLNFDPAVLQFSSATAGSAAAAATLNVNSSQAASGKIGIALALPPGQTFSAGADDIVDFHFVSTANSAGLNSQITFSDAIVGREISDANANTLPADFVAGNVAVNSPPTISSFSDQTIDQGTTLQLSFTINDAETPASSLIVSAHSSNQALLPDSNLGLPNSGQNQILQIAPIANQSGSTTITVSVSDGRTTAQRSFTLTVHSVNHPPVITSIPDVAIDEETSAGPLPFTITDQETPASALTVQGHSANSNLIADADIHFGGSGANRTVTVTPLPGQVGTAVVQITVSDGQLSSFINFQITVRAVNHPPAITSIPDQTTNEDTPLTGIPFSISDRETAADQLQLTITSSNQQLLPDSQIQRAGSGSQRTLSLFPTANQFGTTTIRITVSDGSLTAAAQFNLTVVFVDHPPTITSIPDQTTLVDTPSQRIEFTIGDIDSPLSSLVITPSSSNPTLVPSSNVAFAGTGATRSMIIFPAAHQVGTSDITLEVSDGELKTSTHFKFTVTRPELVLTLSTVADQTADENKPFAPIPFTVNYDDRAITALTVTAASSNSVLFPPSNLLLSGKDHNWSLALTPAPNVIGEATITLTASDASGVTASTTFRATVRSVNTAPTVSKIQDQTTTDGVPITVPFTIGDAESPVSDLVLLVHSLDPTLLDDAQIIPQGTGADRTITITPVPGRAGKVQIQVTAKDPQGATGSSTFFLTIAGNVPVIKDLSPSRNVLAGQDVTFNVTAVGTPPLEFQWLLNDVAIPGAIASSITLPKVTSANAGAYKVKISNVAGSVTSTPVFLTINSAVEITAQPQDQIVAGGNTARFTVQASGTDPIQYQWRKNGVILLGATDSSLVLDNVQPSAEGDYSVDVRNPAGEISSRSAHLTVNIAPLIQRQPQSKTVGAGSDITFGIDAIGTDPLTFQWQLNGQDIPGETRSFLRLSSVQPAANGNYRVRVQNPAGQALSDEATLTVQIAPAITSDLQDIIVKEGDPISLSVPVSGTGPFTFKWYFGGQAITGADQSSFVIPKAQLSDDGFYAVDVFNSAGIARSRSAHVKVSVAPVITSQPRSRVVVAGGEAEFEVDVSGTEILSYQWKFNGTDIPGANSADLDLNNLTSANEGDYTVVVSNFAGTVTSQPAHLTINTPITITQQPATQSVKAGDPVTFTVAATGSPPLTFQWFFAGNPVANQTGATWTLNNVQPNNAGAYSVVVSNPAGSEASAEAVLTVTIPVTIVAQPLSQTVAAGETVRFFVRANGTDPLSYQWFFNGTLINGETGPNLIRNEVDSNAAGNYTVSVSNSLGTVTSSPATLTVLSPPTLNALPAVQTVAQGSSVTFTITPTGQGPFTFQWLLNGVSIPNANSATLVLSNLQPSNSGSYSVVVAGPGGALTSNTSLLIVSTQSLDFADDFNFRPVVTQGSGSVMGDNSTATSQPGEPRHSPGRDPEHSVWFAWRAPATGIASFDTRGSSFDTVLAAYTGDILNLLKQIASDEDSGGFLTSAITFSAQQGELYQIAIDGAGSASGHIVVNWNLVATAATLPVITVQPVSLTVLTNKQAIFSVTAQGDPPLTYQWLKDGTNIPNANASVFTIAQAQPADAGTYSVRVTSGVAPNQASILSDNAILQINLIETGDEGPGVSTENKFGDLFHFLPHQRFALDTTRPFQSVARGFTSAQVFSTKTAVKEPGEPNHCGVVGGASAWSLFEPSTNGTVRVSTEGSDFDTVLAIYTGPGTDFASLVSVACDNNSGADGKTSVVTFDAKAGTTYFVVVDGVKGARGTVQLTLELAQTPVILQQPTFELVPKPIRLEAFAPEAATGTPSVGSDVKLSVVASNPLANAILSYQWKKNGIDLPGATSSTLILRNVQAADFGNYSVDVANFAGVTTSQPFILNVAAPVSIITAPQDQNAAIGDTVIFNVNAAGSGLTYQWQFNGGPIRGANKASLALSNVQPVAAGQYTVVIQNAAGGSASASARLTLTAAPVITVQPQSQTVPLNGNTTLSVTATGTGTLSYQWRFKGVDILGANSPTLSLSNLQPSNAGDYAVVVANNGGSIVSAPAILIVDVPLVFTQQPAGQNAVLGSTVTLSAAASGTLPLLFQWQKNGVDIAGQASPTLTLNNVQPSDSATYQLKVSNAQGSITSGQAVVTVAQPPVITQQPQSQTAPAGASVSFTVAATGSPTLRYQWRLQGADVAGATSPTLTLSSVNNNQAGKYTVLVTNDVGVVISSEATLTVNVPLTITQQPQNQAAAVDSTVSFSVTATASGPITYQWQFNDADIPNATGPSLLLTGVQVKNEGKYKVILKSGTDSLTSSTATLTVSAKEPLVFKSIRLQNDNLFHFQTSGPIGQNFILQTSADFKTWTDVTNFVFSAATLELTDPPAAQPGVRFYRLFSPNKPAQ